MCLIVIKPAGINLPKAKRLRQWFVSHPDGFGLAFPYNGRVRILKGALTENEMFSLIKKTKTILSTEETKALPIILHFRQATTGFICPENCHPFPVTTDQKELSALDVETDIALVHNGMIFDYSSYRTAKTGGADDTKTDTQRFIEDYLADMGEALWHPKVQSLILAYTESKFALLSNKEVTRLGSFLFDQGVYYSNSGYKPSEVKPFQRAYGSQVDYDYALEESEYIASYAQPCSGCNTTGKLLYQLEDDEFDSLCKECFTFFYRREPYPQELSAWL